MTWWAANSHCKSKGGKLVEIDSKKENTALVEEINRRGYADRDMNFWIGLTNQGTWWLASSGLKPSYLNWHYNQPDGGAQKCARIRIGPFHTWKDTWSDIYCGLTRHTNSMHALCEFSQTAGDTATEDPSSEDGLTHMTYISVKTMLITVKLRNKMQ